jgi:hypothetical protein
VRLVGVKLSNLVSIESAPAPQLDLFPDDTIEGGDDLKKEKIEDVLGNLRENFVSRIKLSSLLD